jgi:hypothetical protein
MKSKQMIKYQWIKCIFIMLAVVYAMPEGAWADGPAAATFETNLRMQLISFIQSGAQVENIPPTSLLYPLRSTPLVATTVFLLTEDDPAALSRIYHDLSRVVSARLERDRLTPEGFIPGVPYHLPSGEIHLSPAVNALAVIELQSLHLIAARIGEHEDAIEWLSWSRRYANAVTQVFYNPSGDGFFPLDSDGHTVERYMPEQLLPLLTDWNLSEKTRSRIAESFLNKRRILARSGSPKVSDESLWNDPLTHPVIFGLLEAIPAFSHRMSEFKRQGSERAVTGAGVGQTHRDWYLYWKNVSSITPRLYPTWAVASSLVHLVLLLEEHDLLPGKQIESLRSDADQLVEALGRNGETLESYVSATHAANRLLAGISKINDVFVVGSDQWRAVDDRKWRTLSPRTKRLIKEASATSLDELIMAKTALSRKATGATGIVTDMHFSHLPGSGGLQIGFNAMVKSEADSLAISQLYLQIGENRWTLSEAGEYIPLVAGRAPFSFSKPLPISPTANPRMITLPVFFDFKFEGKRIEIHSIENIALTKGHEVSLNFPNGRRLGDRRLPMQILLKYNSVQSIQGVVKGKFLKEIRCEPELPARFVVKKNGPITTLPLELLPAGKLPPGKYPFAISVTLDGKPIGNFEDYIVRPVRWFHLGPLSNPRYVLNSATEYQDDLFKKHESTDGFEVMWQEVPDGAIDGDGAVRPGNLYAAQLSSCMLLYTVIDAPARIKARWSLETDGPASLWINSVQVLSGTLEGAGNSFSGHMELRKGLNSFLVAMSWKDKADRVLFEISDPNELPIAGISNEIEKIVDGFDRIASQRDDYFDPDEEDRLHEVVFTLYNEDAKDICIIGSFNNWEPGVTAMKKEKDGMWQAVVLLPKGKYSYKFLINKNTKITDPASQLFEADGFGGMNSIRLVK